MANVIIDQFGRDVTLRKVDDEHFEVRVDVVVSNQFFGWIVALAGKVVISMDFKDIYRWEFSYNEEECGISIYADAAGIRDKY